ncbi:MAG TPA: ABC transporter permease, partial [Acidimicrobiales bacterium]|nr:ABC transporter permease [Acidimicrobiales bacterium]
MGSFIGRRVAAMVPLLVLITLGVYALLLLIPGDPARTLAGGLHAQPADIVRVRHQLHLDQPFLAQYWRWVTHAVRGDLGRSLFQHESVASAISSRFPLTLSLALGGLVVSVLIGLPAGVLAGTRPATVADRSVTVASSAGIAVPDFWLAILLAVVFAVKLHLLPDLGYVGLTRSPWGWFEHLLLPWLALGVAGGATLARQVRGALIDVLDQDYIRTARSAGVPERQVIFRLALKNALTPAMTIVGIQFAYLLGGTVIIEQIFSIPGMGSLMLQAIDTKDLPVIQGVVLLTAVIFVVVNLAVDVAYGFLNPKVRVS